MIKFLKNLKKKIVQRYTNFKETVFKQYSDVRNRFVRYYKEFSFNKLKIEFKQYILALNGTELLIFILTTLYIICFISLLSYITVEVYLMDLKLYSLDKPMLDLKQAFELQATELKATKRILQRISLKRLSILNKLSIDHKQAFRNYLFENYLDDGYDYYYEFD